MAITAESIKTKLKLNLSSPINYLSDTGVKSAYETLVIQLEKCQPGNVNIILTEIVELVKRKWKTVLTNKKRFNEMKKDIETYLQKCTSSQLGTVETPPPSQHANGKKTRGKLTQNKGQVSPDSKVQYGQGQYESSIEKLKYIYKMIADITEVHIGPNTTAADEINHLTSFIQTKIIDIESHCVDVSKQITNMQSAFEVQKEDVSGGIKCIPLWKGTLDDILQTQKHASDPKGNGRIQRKIEAQVAIHENVPQQNVTPHNRGPMPETHTATDFKERSSFTGQKNNTTEKHEENAHTLKKDVDDLKLKLKGETEVNKKLRMSKVSSSKLADHNPGITDLSDPNRITRLADIFCEIYENVGTDSLEALIGRNRMRTEKEAVLHMASILKVCYSYCKNKSDETLEQMEGVLLLKSQKNGDVGLDKEEHKQLKDMLKSTGVRTSKCLNQDDLIKYVLDRNLEKDMQKYQAFTKDFTQQCLEICWLMVVQDPPVVLYWGDSTVGSPIDADRFKTFNRSGEYLEYVVWPALLLHTDGPLLKKGIVQPQQSQL